MSRVLLVNDNESIMDRTAGMLEDIGRLAVTRGRHDDTLLKVAKVCGANHHVIGPVSAAKLFAAIEAGRVSGCFHAGPQ